MFYLCPVCHTEMIQTDNRFWIHCESTDCAPEPWPDSLSVIPTLNNPQLSTEVEAEDVTRETMRRLARGGE